MQRLFLIRHAEPEADWPSRFLGRSDPDLSLRGREQATMITRRLPECAQLPVWVSPLRRALNTARLAFPDGDLLVEPLSMEVDFGALDGLLPSEAKRLYPEAWSRLGVAWPDCVVCGGESRRQLRRRADRLKSKLAEQQAVVLVSHQYLLSALVAALTGGRRPQPLDYAAGLVVVRERGARQWRLAAEDGYSGLHGGESNR